MVKNGIKVVLQGGKSFAIVWRCCDETIGTGLGHNGCWAGAQADMHFCALVCHCGGEYGEVGSFSGSWMNDNRGDKGLYRYRCSVLEWSVVCGGKIFAGIVSI